MLARAGIRQKVRYMAVAHGQVSNVEGADRSEGVRLIARARSVRAAVAVVTGVFGVRRTCVVEKDGLAGCRGLRAPPCRRDDSPGEDCEWPGQVESPQTAPSGLAGQVEGWMEGCPVTPPLAI